MNRGSQSYERYSRARRRHHQRQGDLGGSTSEHSGPKLRSSCDHCVCAVASARLGFLVRWPALPLLVHATDRKPQQPMSTTSATFDLTAHGITVTTVHHNLPSSALYEHAILFVTVLPLMLIGIFARAVLKMNFM